MAARVHHEVEHTYAPPPGAAVPDLTALPGVVRVAGPVVHDLHATYHDTDDLALTRAGVTLRSRRGGSDEGWHLKLPAGAGAAGRDEVHARLGRGSAVPARLRGLVTAWTLGAPLVPVATVDTRRTAYSLLGEDGAVLAELADDEVTGTRLDGVPVTWREWELELVEGGADLLDAADEHLAGLGVELRPLARKIAVTLGDRLPAPLPPPEDPLHRYLAEQVTELKVRDSQVRRGDPAGIHGLRQACRRLRAALAAGRPVLDRTATDPLREELRWAAGLLAEARDARVVRERLLVLLDAERDGVAPVRRLLVRSYDERERAAVTAAVDALGSERYLALLAALDRLAADPPFAGPVTPKLLRKRLRREADRVADRLGDPDVGLHEVRKAAKRWRDTAALAEPALGKEARKARKRARALARRLGEWHDAEVSARELVALGRAASAAGENAFVLGRLHAQEQARAAAAAAEVRTR